MSERVSINIEVLGLNITHNYIVPNDMHVLLITNLILKTLTDEYPDAECNKDSNHCLVQANTGKVLSQDCNLRQLGIVSGERLILM